MRQVEITLLVDTDNPNVARSTVEKLLHQHALKKTPVKAFLDRIEVWSMPDERSEDNNLELEVDYAPLIENPQSKEGV